MFSETEDRLSQVVSVCAPPGPGLQSVVTWSVPGREVLSFRIVLAVPPPRVVYAFSTRSVPSKNKTFFSVYTYIRHGPSETSLTD